MKKIRPRRWRRSGVIGVVSLLVAGGGAAGAEPTADFPPTFAPEALAAWVKSNTDLPFAAIAWVSTSGSVAVLPERAGRQDLIEARVWIETLDPQLAEEEGALSWTSEAAADCTQGQLRFGAATGFARRKRQGPVVRSRAPDTQWRVPSAGEPSEAIWRAICGRPVITAFSTLPPAAAEAPPLSVTPPARADQSVARAASQPDNSGAPEKPWSSMRSSRVFTIQFAAMPSAAAGERVRSTITGRFAGIVGARSVQVVRADLGRRVVYRVLISDLKDATTAERLCGEFRRAGQECLVRGASKPHGS